MDHEIEKMMDELIGDIFSNGWGVTVLPDGSTLTVDYTETPNPPPVKEDDD
jgi:hypothetical protein